MNVKIENGIRSTDTSAPTLKVPLKTMVKDKARKQLWERLLEVYENERGLKTDLEGLELTRSLMQSLDEELRCNNGCISLQRLVDKHLQKKQARHLKRTARYKSAEANIRPLSEQLREKRKTRKPERPKLGLRKSKKLKESQGDELQVQPLIVLHERVGKHLTNSSDRVLPEQKQLHNTRPETERRDKSNSKCRFQESNLNTNSSYGQTHLQYEKETQEHHGSIISNTKPVKEKVKRRKKIGMTYKTSEKDASSQLRRRTRNYSNQQMIKEIAKSLGISDDMLNKIKNLPFTIDESQFIFMDPSHISKILESCNDLSKTETQRKYNSSKNIKCEFEGNSGFKLSSDQVSSKRLKYLSSRKLLTHTKKWKNNNQLTPGTLDNFQDPLSITNKDKTEKRRKKRYSVVEKKNNVKNIKGDHKSEKNVHKMQFINDEGPVMSTREIRPKIEDAKIKHARSYSNKLSTIFSEPPVAPAEGAFGDYNLDTCAQIKTENKKNKKIKSAGKDQNRKLRTKFNLSKSSNCEDGKKLTLKLVKPGTIPEKMSKGRRNIYSLNGNQMLKPSEGSSATSLHKDRLMLFYANRESSTTSKESLNIAISRDTEISDNGSSNNILNVVIKQTKNSVSNTTTSYFTTLDEKQDKNIVCHKEPRQHKAFNKAEVSKEVNKCVKKDNSYGGKNFKDAWCQTEQSILLKKGNTKVKSRGEQINTNTKITVKNKNNGTFNITTEDNNTNKFNSNRLDNFTSKIIKVGGASIINRTEDFSSLTEAPIKSDMSALILKTNHKNVGLFNCEKEFDSCVKRDRQAFASATDQKNNFFRVLNKNETHLNNTHTSHASHLNDFKAPLKNYATTLTSKNKQVEPELSYEDGDKIKAGNQNTKPEFVQDTSVNIEPESKELNRIELLKNKAFVKIIEAENSLQKSFSTEKTNLKPTTENICSINNEVSSSSKNHNVKITINNNFQGTSLEKKDIILQNSTNYISVPNSDKRIAKINYNNSKQFKLFPKEEIKTSKEMSEHLNESPLSKNNRVIKIKREFSPVRNADIQKKRENFFSVIPTEETVGDVLPSLTIKADNDMLNHKNNEDCHFKCNPNHTNKCFPNTKVRRTFGVSEIGVQTETSQYIGWKNDALCNTDLQCNASVKLLGKKQLDQLLPSQIQPKTEPNKLVFGKNIFVSIEDNLETKVPEKKGTFVHVVTNKNSEKDNDIDSSISKKSVKSLQSSENVRFLRISKNEKYEKEQQIIYKINAIYEFLQYLDKMLKNNAFIRTNENCRADLNIGMFNSTLRCLCSNCMDILDKLEASKMQSYNSTNIPTTHSFEKKPLLQHDNKKSKFVNIINEQNEELSQDKENEYQEEKYLNISEIERTINQGIHDKRKQNQMFTISNPKPFFVVVPSNESLRTSFKYTKFDSNFEKGSGDQVEQQGFNLDDQIGSLLMTRKINNYILQANGCYYTNKIENKVNKKEDIAGFNNSNKQNSQAISKKRHVHLAGKDCSEIKERIGINRLQRGQLRSVNCQRSVGNVDAILNFKNEHREGNSEYQRLHCTDDNLKRCDCTKKTSYHEDLKYKSTNKNAQCAEKSKGSIDCKICIFNQPLKDSKVDSNTLKLTHVVQGCSSNNSVDSSNAIGASEEQCQHTQEGKHNTDTRFNRTIEHQLCEEKHTGNSLWNTTKRCVHQFRHNLKKFEKRDIYYNHSKDKVKLQSKVNKNGNSFLNLADDTDSRENIKSNRYTCSCCNPKCRHFCRCGEVSLLNNNNNISMINENGKMMKLYKEGRQQKIVRTHLPLSLLAKNKNAKPLKNYMNLEENISNTPNKSQNHFNLNSNKRDSPKNLKKDSKIMNTPFVVGSESSIGTVLQHSSMIFLNKNINFTDKNSTSDNISSGENGDGMQFNYPEKQDSLQDIIYYNKGWISISNPNLQNGLNDETLWQNESEASCDELELKISHSAEVHTISDDSSQNNFNSLVNSDK